MPVSSSPKIKNSNPSPESPDAPGNRILVIDSDYDLSKSIRNALNGLGHDVLLAQDGNVGIALIETQNPSLIITDLMMPKRSGLLILERLAISETDPIPIIVITANEGHRHRKYAELLGVSEYLIKPFTMDRLLESVGDLLGNSNRK